MVFVLFLVSPLLALVLSFKDIKSKQFYYVLLLMAAFMGLVLNTDVSGDISRYLEYPSVWRNLRWVMVFNERDYLFPILSKLFSYISINKNCFGAFIFVIYAALYLQSFKIITEHVSNQSNLWYFISTFAIFLIFPYSRFFSMRFSLASLLFFWCILEIVIKKNKRFYWVLLLVPLMHYSFLPMITLPYLHLLLKKRLTLCLIIFSASFFINTPQIAYYLDDFAMSYLPKGTSDVVDKYASEEGLEYMKNRDADRLQYVNEKGVFFKSMKKVTVNLIMYALVLIVLVSFKSIKGNESLLHFFTLLLVAFTMANMLSSASRGNRFVDIACALTVFILYWISHCEGSESTTINFVKKNRVIVFIIFIAAILYGVLYNYAMRWDYDYTLVLFGNPVLAILKIMGII